jgi:hypothetical protein
VLFTTFFRHCLLDVTRDATYDLLEVMKAFIGSGRAADILARYYSETQPKKPEFVGISWLKQVDYFRFQ